MIKIWDFFALHHRELIRVYREADMYKSIERPATALSFVSAKEDVIGRAIATIFIDFVKNDYENMKRGNNHENPTV